jgi:hypothetical protein
MSLVLGGIGRIFISLQSYGIRRRGALWRTSKNAVRYGGQAKTRCAMADKQKKSPEVIPGLQIAVGLPTVASTFAKAMVDKLA